MMTYTWGTEATLVDLLRKRATETPERLGYSFIREDGTHDDVTYGELDRKARAFAVHLKQRHQEGERALLLYPPGLEYVIAYFGCLYAGILAVPAYPPRANVNLTRLESIVEDAAATAALTTSSIHKNAALRFAESPRLSGLNWVAIDDVEESLADQWTMPSITPETIAFLQYTSGSTSAPKGVMVSHGNLLHNEWLFQQKYDTNSDDVWCHWLPPFHDMGLIAGILHPLYSCAPAYMMSPVDFITRPLFWLEAISKYKATFSGAPNFALELCLKKVTPEQRDKLDLSHMRCIFCGAEPNRPETFAAFNEYFAPAGFKENVLSTAYGLAEATLVACMGEWKKPVKNTTFHGESLKRDRAMKLEWEGKSDRTLMSHGNVNEQFQRIAIVNPNTLQECREGEVGEIWIKGPSVAQGYWQRPEQTQEDFGAHLADTEEGPFLRTGDLGVVFEEELYVTGRMKDVIIIRGRNYYPTDIETSAQKSHTAVSNSNGAAFAVDIDGEERLVVVQEMERTLRKTPGMEVARAIRAAVSEEHQLQVHAVVLIKPASISKTSSG